MASSAGLRHSAKGPPRPPKGAAANASMKVNEPMRPEERTAVTWLRRNLPTKRTKFLHSHQVEYFTAAKAVDALINESPWCRSKAATESEVRFGCRDDAVAFLDLMLRHKMFHRARKIPVQDRVKPGGKRARKEESEEDEQQSKKKRRIRLDMHLDQIFLDGTDAYVWLYDPVAWYYWVGGAAIVVALIAFVLFPLWPSKMRIGVQYLSMAAAGFLMFILFLGVLQWTLYGLLYALSGAKLKFWLLPNLFEDVGFLDSFFPLYDYTYTGETTVEKAKDSDNEEEDDDDEVIAGKAESSESEDSTSRKSSTGKDFEMVDEDDTDVQDED